MSSENTPAPLEGLEAVRAQAGFNHTHVAGDFYFTPVKPGDRVTPNYHLSYQAITTPPREADLNLTDIATLRRAVIDGVNFNAVCEAGFLYTPKAGENPFLHRSPAAEYRLVLKEGFRCAPSAEESGQRMFTVECMFRPGDTVRVKEEAPAPVDTLEPRLERLEMTVDKYDAGVVYVYWRDDLRAVHEAQFSPAALEHVPAAAPEVPEAGEPQEVITQS